MFLQHCPCMWTSLDDHVGLQQQRLHKNGCGFLSYSAPPNCSAISSLLCVHPVTKGYWINSMSSSWTGSLAQALAELSSLVIQQRCGVSSEGSRAGTHLNAVMPHPSSGMSQSLSSPHQVMRGGCWRASSPGFVSSPLYEGIPFGAHWDLRLFTPNEMGQAAQPSSPNNSLLTNEQGRNVSWSFHETGHLFSSCFLNKALLLAFTQGGVRLEQQSQWVWTRQQKEQSAPFWAQWLIWDCQLCPLPRPCSSACHCSLLTVDRQTAWQKKDGSFIQEM